MNDDNERALIAIAVALSISNRDPQMIASAVVRKFQALQDEIARHRGEARARHEDQWCSDG